MKIVFQLIGLVAGRETQQRQIKKGIVISCYAFYFYKMKKLILISLTIIFPVQIQAQLFNSAWIMGVGNGTGLGANCLFDFKQGYLNIIPLPSVIMPNTLSNTSICDSAGNLLFFTNGITVFDSTYNVMQNGDTLNPSAYTFQCMNSQAGMNLFQSCITIPFPDYPNQYYIFHCTVDTQIFNPPFYQPLKLYYSIVDMMGNGGLGKVVSKNSVLINDTLLQGRITACKHANGRDWWLVAHKFNSRKFIKWLITPSGIVGPYYQLIGGNQSAPDAYGYVCFSDDGKKFALVDEINSQSDPKIIEIFNFDRCTGDFSDSVYIEIPAILDSAYAEISCAFSPSGRYLYFCNVWYIYQFDLLATNIPASKKKVAEFDGYVDSTTNFIACFDYMKLAPDGRIYVGCNSNLMSYIAYPDSADTLCTVLQHSITMSVFNALAIPNTPNYNLGSLSGSPCDTLTSLSFLTSQNELVVSITPNPASNSFYINYNIPTNENLLFVLYDCFGKEMLRKMLYGSFKNLLVYTDRLSDGVYFWSATSTKNQKQNGKVVILR